MDKIGYLVLNVGNTGTGKSTMIKKIIDTGARVCVYDFQGEYEDLPTFKEALINKNFKQFRFIGADTSIESFMEFVHKHLVFKGYNIIIEEATGVFNSSRSDEFTRLILSKRHHLTSYILNFHALQRVTPSIYEYCDILYLRKTGDFEKNIKNKFPNIFEDWNEIKKSQNKYMYKVLYLSTLTAYQ